MNDNDWDQLCEMRENINRYGLTHFNSDYLEEYTRLLALSLQGKGDQMYPLPPDKKL